MLSKQEYLDIINFIQFFYVQNFEATAQVRSLKTERLQKEDENNLSNKLALLSEVINEHFELKENHTALSLAFDDLYDLIYRPKPYKFDDLKPSMWIWDKRLKTCFLIKEIINAYEYPIIVYRNHLGDELDGLNFAEGRYFPVTKAMEEFKNVK